MIDVQQFVIKLAVQGQRELEKLTDEMIKADKEAKDLDKSLDKLGDTSKKAGAALSKKSKDVNQLKDSMKDLGTNVAGSIGLTNQFSDSIVGVGRALGPLATVVGVTSIAITALGFRAVNAADQIQDISDATGITAGRLLNFKQSLIDAGGSAEDMEKIALKLNQTLGEAASGNAKIEKTFNDIGVNIRLANGEFRKADEILPEVIKSLGEIGNKSVRSATAVDLLGKSAARINWENVSAIDNALGTKQIEHLSAINGLLDKINNTIETKLIGTFGDLAIAINRGPIESLSELGGLMLEATERGSGLLSILMAIGDDSVWNKLKDLGSKGIGSISEEIRKLTSDKNYQKLDERGSLLSRFPAPKVDDSVNMAENARLARSRLVELTAEQYKLVEASKIQVSLLQQQSDEAIKLQKTINQISNEQRVQNSLSELQANIKKSNAQIDAQAAMQVANLNRQIAIERMDTQRDSRVTAAIISDLQASVGITLRNAEQQKRLKAEELIILDRANSLENARRLQVEAITAAYERQRNIAQALADITLSTNQELANIERERAKRGMTPMQQQVFDVVEGARSNQLREQRAFANLPQFMSEDGLTPENATALATGLDLIASKWNKISSAQLENIEYQERQRLNAQLWEQGWKKAFDEYAKNATNGAKIATDIFDIFINRTTDAFKGLITRQKKNFREFAREILADLSVIFLRMQAINLFKSLGTKFNIGDIFKNLLGYANGGNPPVNRPSIVGERGPELFMPKTAGTIIPNDELGKSGVTNITNITNNISAVDARSVAQLFAENRRSLLGATEQARKEMPMRQRF